MVLNHILIGETNYGLIKAEERYVNIVCQTSRLLIDILLGILYEVFFPFSDYFISKVILEVSNVISGTSSTLRISGIDIVSFDLIDYE